MNAPSDQICDAFLWKGHAIPTPFRVYLQTRETPVQFTCSRVLRNLPGKRLVCQGDDQGRPVVVKFFLDRRRADLHCRREEQGISALKAAGIPCPVLAGKGHLPPQNTPVLVFEKIPFAVDFAEAWDQAESDERRAALLSRTVSLLARLHQAGLAHQDAHFGNFMVADSEIYTIDGAALALSRRGRPLSKSRSIRNLAVFLAQVSPQFDHLLPEAHDAYFKAQGWGNEKETLGFLHQRLGVERKKREKKFLKKIYRESSARIRRKTWRRFQVWDRSLHTEAMGRFLADPDGFIARGELLKDGNSSTVALVTVDGRPLVVKRYNMKNFWHLLKRCLRPSRAWHSWAEAHRLGLLGIPTPRPVAFVENRWGPLRSKAYFITEYAPGPDAFHWFHSEHTDPDADQKIITAFARMMQRFFEARITHGDLKATNFMFSDGALMVIDLDAMQSHPRPGPGFRRKFKKDCRRLLRNWKDLPEIEKKFQDALSGLC